MSGYVILDVNITDPAVYEEFLKQVIPAIEAYGGRYLVQGGDTEVMEGDWNPSRLVIIEFDSVEQARAWYHSDEYAGPKATRHASSECNTLIVAGV